MSEVKPFPGEHVEQHEPPKARLVPIPWSDLHSLPKREPLVGGLLDRVGMSVLFGGSNTGKTFFGLDLSARVALDWPWRGRTIRHGAVVYIAAEGGLGIEERLTAFRYHHDIEADGVPLFVIPEPIDLCRADTDTELLLERIAALPTVLPVELIVVDTLSRAMAGGNENSPDDMGRFVRHCDTLRLGTEAHLMVIHHAGKDDSRGARGHSLLKAAADTEIEVTKSEATGNATATVVKQRDHATGDAFGFKLEPVEIGMDADENRVTSCVVVETEGEAPKGERKGRPPKAAQIALKALHEAVAECGEPAPASNHIPPNARIVSLERWRDYAYRRGISTSDEPKAKSQAFKRASEHLIAGGTVGVWSEQAWLAQ